jgi:hypothetical protein
MIFVYSRASHLSNKIVVRKEIIQKHILGPKIHNKVKQIKIKIKIFSAPNPAELRFGKAKL